MFLFANIQSDQSTLQTRVVHCHIALKGRVFPSRQIHMALEMEGQLLF